MKKSFWMIAIILITLNACKKDETSSSNTTPTPEVIDIPANYIKLGETWIGGAAAKATVYGLKAPFTGYNKLYTLLTDSTSGKVLKNGHLSIYPEMTMPMMTHSSPVDNQESEVPNGNFYEGAVVFTMPSTAGVWRLKFNYHNHASDKEGNGSMELNVVQSDPARSLSFIAGDDSSKVVLALVEPEKWKNGLNDFEITLHKKGMTDFPEIKDYTVEIEPEMPSMGHGSPNNVNPVYTKHGHYLGKVNFTMSGLWQVNIRLYKNGKLIKDGISFTITL